MSGRQLWSSLVALSVMILLCTPSTTAMPRQKHTTKASTAGTAGTATKVQTPQQQAAQIPGGISTATDGSTILDQTVNINNLPIRFKVSAPANLFTTTSGLTGGTAAAGDQSALGINILLHGDGGQSFFDFPNQAVQANTLGVVALAPDPNLFWGGGSGLQRTDGVAHSQAVADLLTQTLPSVVAFNHSNVFFTGVSGGSLLLSGFFMPAQMGAFPNSGVLLNCGALPPQVTVDSAAAKVLAGTRVHFQSTQLELAELQPVLPKAISALEKVVAGEGLSSAQIGALMTVDNEPVGGHCEFDGKDFVSGVQLMADSFSNVIQGGNGEVDGIGNVDNPVVGNENLQFSGASKMR